MSLQTHGAYGANFNPHAHALVSDGVFTRQGEFLPLPSLDPAAVMDVFRRLLLRRLLLRRLRQAERLSESFMGNLLSWVHPGFSVFAGPPVDGALVTSLESQGRYITRPALAMDALQILDDGNLALETRPDPRTGVTGLVLDPLSMDSQDYSPHSRSRAALPTLLRRLLEPGQSRKILRGTRHGHANANAHEDRDNSDFSREARSTWARLIRKIFEADPLVCACGAHMRIISFITEPRVVDRILRHRKSERCKAKDPFVARPPPRIPAPTLQ